MEQDDWPDSLADTGYDAFVNAVLLAVAKVAASFQHATHEPTKKEIENAIKAVKDTAADTVNASINNAMSGWQLPLVRHLRQQRRHDRKRSVDC
jgi:hypothetical protein